MHRLAVDEPGESSKPPARRTVSEGRGHVGSIGSRTKGGASSRVEDITSSRGVKDVSLPKAATSEPRSWGQTICDVGIYGSTLGTAYRLLQPPDPVIQPHSTANSRDRTTVSFPREGEERKGVGVNATSEFKDLQAALHDAVSSPIIWPAGDDTEGMTLHEHEYPPSPLSSAPHGHSQTQWPFRPNVRRPRTDPSRLSRISYISTLSTQSSSLSSMSIDWYSPTPETPESEYLQTPPPPPRQVSSADDEVMGNKPPVLLSRTSAIGSFGLGLHFDNEQEQGKEEDDKEGIEEDESLDRLDAILARIQELTDEGRKALDLGSTRIVSRLPVNMSAARRKLHPSLD